MSAEREVARAIDALRRGWPVAIASRSGPALTLLAVETADDLRLRAVIADGRFDVLISRERAETLNLTNQGAAAGPGAVRIGTAPWLDLPTAVALADPALDLARPLKGPFRTVPIADEAAAGAALELARLAGLLPAFIVVPAVADNAPLLSADAVAAYTAPGRIAIVARARLPTRFAETCEIVAFRSPEEAVEHVALVLGEPDGRPPLVRLHSECLTGDALGSLKCDCGPQLDRALERIATEGWGILLYLRQEGRGIGLVNKLRAYALQDQGYDTVDANLRLGFAIDARDFAVAGRMLDALGQSRIRLLSNNPAKVAALETAGCTVVERVPHAIGANPHNHRYLETKRDRTGHQL